jgi:hypothetical protein
MVGSCPSKPFRALDEREAFYEKCLARSFAAVGRKRNRVKSWDDI